MFLTYIGKFKQNYVTALYIGEGISSLLPGVLALAQGMGEDYNCNKNFNSTNINSTNTRKRVASRDLEKAPPGSLNFILCKLSVRPFSIFLHVK